MTTQINFIEKYALCFPPPFLSFPFVLGPFFSPASNEMPNQNTEPLPKTIQSNHSWRKQKHLKFVSIGFLKDNVKLPYLSGVILLESLVPFAKNLLVVVFVVVSVVVLLLLFCCWLKKINELFMGE